MENKTATVLVAIVVCILLVVIGYNFAPGVREAINKKSDGGSGCR